MTRDRSLRTRPGAHHTLVGLGRSPVRYDALIADARATAEPDVSAISIWEHARAGAVLARNQLSTRDLASIGAAILQLRVAAEPRWPR